MALVQWTIRAEQDLEAIVLFIGRERQSPRAAASVVERIVERSRTYAEQPLLGETRPELGISIRSFLVFDYVVLYRPSNDGIVVLRVLHGAQEWQKNVGLE